MGDSGGKPDGTIVTPEDRTIANRAHILGRCPKIERLDGGWRSRIRTALRLYLVNRLTLGRRLTSGG